LPAETSDAFTNERPALLGLAYRMLGSLSDAEDVVQDAWLRWSAADRSSIRNPAAWLTTVTTRLALDRTRTVRRRRETYVGPWLPEPVATDPSPEDRAELAESLTLGFLILLDTLSPTERAVLLLADVFATPFADVAAALGKSEEACRQIASRARRKLHRKQPRPASIADRNLLEELVMATTRGDVTSVLSLLDPEVVLETDGGPNRRAARRPFRGADRVARLGIKLIHQVDQYPMTRMVVNNRPSIVIDHPDGPIVAQADEQNGRIVAIRVLMNPDKLAGLQTIPRLR
jgi:RNA polymerase sigma-70 factor (ECF subfamily)